MATKKKATDETADEPAEEATEAKPTDIDKAMRQMAEAQRQSQEAYEDTGPAEPSL